MLHLLVRRLVAGFCCVWLSVLSFGAVAAPAPASSPSLSPDAVAQLGRDGKPYVLINADPSQTHNVSPAPDLYVIWFSNRAVNEPAAKAAALLRKKGHKQSYWLEGTPFDWQQAGLHLPMDVIPSRPDSITAAELAGALKSGADLQIVDLRSPDDKSKPAFPEALLLRPDELQEPPRTLSKRHWLVLIDNGDRVAMPIADLLFAKGFHQVVMLEGGYPAWAAYQRKNR